MQLNTPGAPIITGQAVRSEPYLRDQIGSLLLADVDMSNQLTTLNGEECGRLIGRCLVRSAHRQETAKR